MCECEGRNLVQYLILILILLILSVIMLIAIEIYNGYQSIYECMYVLCISIGARGGGV